MLKIYGATAAQNGLYKIGKKKWEVIYGFGKDNEDDTTGYNYRQRYDHRPTLEEIRADIINQIKQASAENLANGFEWNGLRVQYSEERKTDFTGMIIGLQGGFMQFPIKVNLGSLPDGTPQEYTFTSADELGAVAAMIAAHKQANSDAEWAAINELGDMEAYKTEQ